MATKDATERIENISRTILKIKLEIIVSCFCERRNERVCVVKLWIRADDVEDEDLLFLYMFIPNIRSHALLTQNKKKSALSLFMMYSFCHAHTHICLCRATSFSRSAHPEEFFVHCLLSLFVLFIRHTLSKIMNTISSSSC